MTEETMDLFIAHEESMNRETSIDEAFDLAIEELAADLEVTVDYYMMEFM